MAPKLSTSPAPKKRNKNESPIDTAVHAFGKRDITYVLQNWMSNPVGFEPDNETPEHVRTLFDVLRAQKVRFHDVIPNLTAQGRRPDLAD